MQHAPRTLSHVCDNLQLPILNTVLILLQFLELEAISPSNSAYWCPPPSACRLALPAGMDVTQAGGEH